MNGLGKTQEQQQQQQQQQQQRKQQWRGRDEEGREDGEDLLSSRFGSPSPDVMVQQVGRAGGREGGREVGQIG